MRKQKLTMNNNDSSRKKQQAMANNCNWPVMTQVQKLQNQQQQYEQQQQPHQYQCNKQTIIVIDKGMVGCWLLSKTKKTTAVALVLYCTRSCTVLYTIMYCTVLYTIVYVLYVHDRVQYTMVL